MTTLKVLFLLVVIYHTVDFLFYALGIVGYTHTSVKKLLVYNENPGFCKKLILYMSITLKYIVLWMGPNKNDDTSEVTMNGECILDCVTAFY